MTTFISSTLQAAARSYSRDYKQSHLAACQKLAEHYEALADG